MVVKEFSVPLLGVIKEARNNTREKYMLEERRQNLAESDRWSYYNQEERLEEFSDDKGAFSNGSESDDSDNDNENYTESKEQQQLSESFCH